MNFYRARLVFWCALIYFFSSVPDLGTGFGVWDLILRKFAHAFEFGALFLFARAAFFGKPTAAARSYLLPAIFSIMYAVADEFHQSFVPGRTASAVDVMIDAAGVAAASFLKMKGITEKFHVGALRAGKFTRFAAVIFACAFFAGCGAEYKFARLEKLAAKGDYVTAAVGYEHFASRNPSHPLAPEAVFRAAEIYNYDLRLPAKAASLYRKAEGDYASSPELAEKAKNGLLRAPDYMPLFDGAVWTEGDSVTGGQNMKAVWRAQKISTGAFVVEKKFMAGDKIAAVKKTYYIFSGPALLEKDSPSAPASRVFLGYPVYHGKKWRVRAEEKFVDISLEFVQQPVTVRAGTFTECVRLAERYDDMPSVVKYNYYAPYVGWILTSVSGVKGEHRNSELLSVSIPPRRPASK